MKQIWKYVLETIDQQTLEIPEGAKILTVQVQDGCPCLWALVDPVEEKEPVSIAIFGTGHRIPEDIGEYIGIYQLCNSRLIFHAFKGNV